MPNPPTDLRDSRWDLAAEAIAVKIRWFGVVIGLVLVETRAEMLGNPVALRAILALGAVYAVLDTYFSLRGRVFLDRLPLLVSLLEAVFIGLLCHFQQPIHHLRRHAQVGTHLVK